MRDARLASKHKKMEEQRQDEKRGEVFDGFSEIKQASWIYMSEQVLQYRVQGLDEAAAAAAAAAAINATKLHHGQQSALARRISNKPQP